MTSVWPLWNYANRFAESKQASYAKLGTIPFRLPTTAKSFMAEEPRTHLAGGDGVMNPEEKKILYLSGPRRGTGQITLGCFTASEVEERKEQVSIENPPGGHRLRRAWGGDSCPESRGRSQEASRGHWCLQERGSRAKSTGASPGRGIVRSPACWEASRASPLWCRTPSPCPLLHRNSPGSPHGDWGRLKAFAQPHLDTLGISLGTRRHTRGVGLVLADHAWLPKYFSRSPSLLITRSL